MGSFHDLTLLSTISPGTTLSPPLAWCLEQFSEKMSDGGLIFSSSSVIHPFES